MSSFARSAKSYAEDAKESAFSWPRDFPRDPILSIGQVVENLAQEFPAITVSKVRYLEDQGLVRPTRTSAGYRKYSCGDVERLRFVLQRQRDSFAPLRAIGDELRALDAGHEPSPSRTARVVASEGRVVSTGNRRALPAADLCDLTGADLETLERYVRLGLLTPDIGGYFPARCVQVLTILLQLEMAGIDVRTLRSVRSGAERSADLIDQTVSSQRSRRRSGDAERALARSVELAELLADLHREMLRVSIHQLSGI